MEFSAVLFQPDIFIDVFDLLPPSWIQKATVAFSSMPPEYAFFKRRVKVRFNHLFTVRCMASISLLLILKVGCPSKASTSQHTSPGQKDTHNPQLWQGINPCEGTLIAAFPSETWISRAQQEWKYMDFALSFNCHCWNKHDKTRLEPD